MTDVMRAQPSASPQNHAPGRLRYRLQQSSDTPALMRLREAEIPWGDVHVQFAEWFDRNPCPGSFIAVGVDEHDRIAGQIVLQARRVLVDGKETAALRVYAPIIARVVREAAPVSDPLKHPVIEIFDYAMAQARARGFSLVYSMPSPRWLGFFHRVPGLRFGRFPLWSIPLPLASIPALEDGYTASRLQAWDARVDSLWLTASSAPGCLAIRDASILQWKLGGPSYEVTAVERRGELVGLVAGRQKDRQWSVCDILARDSTHSLRATLAAACGVAQTRCGHWGPLNRVQKIALLVTPGLEPIAAELGFVREAYDFLLLVTTLDPSIPHEAVAPERWYVSDDE